MRVRNDKRVRIRVMDYFDLGSADHGTEVGTQVSEIIEMYKN